jgi:HD-like signal output (HDOD) protein
MAEAAAVPAPFNVFFPRIAMRARLPEIGRRLLDELVDPDATSEDVATILSANQYLEHALLSELRAQGMREKAPGLAAAIALFGMSRTRNFVCALELARVIGRRTPARLASGKLELKTAEQLRFALHAEQFALDLNVRDGELAFMAGLLFDLLTAVAREEFGRPKGFEALVQSVYDRGLQAARAGLELARKGRSPSFTKQVFPACLAHELGRLVFELLYPPESAGAYSKFLEATARAGASRFIAHYAEVERYGVGHERFGALLAGQFKSFRGLATAIRFQYEPHLLQTSQAELAKFAALIGQVTPPAG